MEAFIREISSAAGSKTIDNTEQGKGYEMEYGFVENKLGVLKLPELAEDETPLDLAENAVKKLTTSLEEVDALLYVTQNPMYGGLPHNSAILAGRLGLDRKVACFDIGLGCSGYAYTLSLAASMIESGRHKKVMIVTCDPYRHNLKASDKNTNLLFGDWASASIISTKGTWCIKQSHLETIGKNYKSLIRQDDGIFMHGRAIFNFARNDVSKSLSSFLESLQKSADDIDLFLVHQGSKIVVEELAKKLSIDLEKIPSDMLETGNAVSSSIPLLLEKRFTMDISTILASGFGVGLSIGHILLQKEERK